MIPVRPHTFVRVVAVDEQRPDRDGRRIRGSGIADDEMDVLVQAVAPERVAELLVEVGSREERVVRDVDVVRPQRRPSAQCGGEQERASALEPTDLDDGAVRDVARDLVEPGGLVELLGDDPVIELVAGEEEHQVLESAKLLGPTIAPLRT